MIRLGVKLGVKLVDKLGVKLVDKLEENSIKSILIIDYCSPKQTFVSPKLYT